MSRPENKKPKEIKNIVQLEKERLIKNLRLKVRSWCDIKNELNVETLKALKLCIKGIKTIETTTEYALDEESGKLKIIKQKVCEKNIPPNVDLLKLIYPQLEQKTDYNSLTDEELEKEKQRLLKELKEKENVGWKNKFKN